ncbi:hypothetical protein [Ramlibacter rhizophilus]|uniref:hypothetical protein n=1 Tax=Ramlibacter rhizophilus TaxID=1781167 RepID=UPI0014326EFA|nr:hypothetical protein [Ramlibacter rhizophilus]
MGVQQHRMGSGSLRASGNKPRRNLSLQRHHHGKGEDHCRAFAPALIELIRHHVNEAKATADSSPMLNTLSK